jgi:hypothetical protein
LYKRKSDLKDGGYTSPDKRYKVVSVTGDAEVVSLRLFELIRDNKWVRPTDAQCEKCIL